MTALPIDSRLDEIVNKLRHCQNLVIEAAPGAGKTTRVPPALLSLGLKGEVVALEPRRLATRLAARRVAEELGVTLGAEVGYQVRFEEVAGPKTRLRFVTEGVLTRRLVGDRDLRGISIVVLDEFHERHLDTDLAVALLRRLQKTTRPDLKLVVMSATLDAAPIAAFLGSCEVVRCEGRLFPIETQYTPASNAPLEEEVARSVERLAGQPGNGDVLVFLPGAAEIRRAQRLLEPLARRADLLLAPLFGDLSPQEQDLAVQPGARRKVILSTNIAESSVTIDGVTAVIDSGLARVAHDSPWTGLPSLKVSRISKASANQRAGRAGRTAPGRVIRLFTAEDFARRAEFDKPEIHRRELSQVMLDLRAMDVPPREVEWFEPPPEAAWAAAENLLTRLGAVGPMARSMAKVPLHPRLSRLIFEADKRGAGELGCDVAAALSSGERLEGPPRHASPSDLLLLAEANWQPNTRRVSEQLRRFVRTRRRDDSAIAMSVLAAFPDRLARRRQGRDYALAGGGQATLADSSACGASRFIVAVDIEERNDRATPLIRLASSVEPDWLIELFPDRVEETKSVEWNREANRVDGVDAILYDGFAIDETRGALPDSAAAAKLLADKARQAGLERFIHIDELNQFFARVAFAAGRGTCEAMTPDDALAALDEICVGCRSFRDLEQLGILTALEQRLRVRLDDAAPTRLRLPGGRNAKVEYAIGQSPWVASRLQDFFGMKETPKIGGVPLVVHLLAPNQRPLQVTSDLAGFWKRHYPDIRRELSRRYPRHSWPETP